jgi:hypothetical protein
MATVNEKFQSAPMGRRVAGVVVLTFAILLVAVGVNVFVALNKLPGHTTPTDRVVVAIAPLVGILVTMPVFLYERSKIARFQIEENCLVLGGKRFPLEGLSEVARDDRVLCRAIRVWGNGGLGSIRGWFRSKRLGKFYAFMTDTEKAVVLRWPDKVVAVSPTDPEFFILSARSAAGLR